MQLALLDINHIAVCARWRWKTIAWDSCKATSFICYCRL